MDQVLLDLLQETSGWEVVRRLTNCLTTHDILIIVLSGVGSVEGCIQLLEAGIDDFIVKPFSVKEVIARARAVLRRAEWRPGTLGGRGASDDDGYDSYRG
jgi:two-component system, OmpR family, phosphate regulon response regulator PhoB